LDVRSFNQHLSEAATLDIRYRRVRRPNVVHRNEREQQLISRQGGKSGSADGICRRTLIRRSRDINADGSPCRRGHE